MITLTFTLEELGKVGEKKAVKITPKWESTDKEKNNPETEVAHRINVAVKLIAGGELTGQELARRLKHFMAPKIATPNNKILWQPKHRR